MPSRQQSGPWLPIEDIDANNDGIPDVYQDTRDGETGNTSGTADPPQR